jgi:hypothetical protein
MASSKKDYEAAATLLRGSKGRTDNLARSSGQSDREGALYVQVETARIARDFADYFGRGNPRFDRERFLDACGYPLAEREYWRD